MSDLVGNPEDRFSRVAALTYNDSVIKKTRKHFSRGYVIFLLILDIAGHFAMK